MGEEELLVQSGGRHRFRQRLRKGGNRGANKRSRLSRRRSFMKLRTEKDNKARRFKKIRKNNEDKIKKVQYADEDIEDTEERRQGEMVLPNIMVEDMSREAGDWAELLVDV